MGGKKKYIEMFGSFTDPFNYDSNWVDTKIKALFVVEKTVFNIQSLLLLEKEVKHCI